MKVKNTIKSKNLSEDNNLVDEDIGGSIVDEESDDSVDEDEEMSDASVAGDESDDNAEEIGTSGTESVDNAEDLEVSGAESDNDAEDLGASATESDDADDLDASGAESDNDAEDLGASATESDEDVSDDEDTATEEPLISKSEMIKRNVLQKYQESHGKQLYIRFPRTISDDEVEQKVKELSPLIIKVHKPRQKSARFCLVDFETKDNRDITLKALKKLIKKGELEKYQIDIPRTESPEYVHQIAELKIKSLENKKVKARLKRASNKASKLNSFTSSVLVFNLPKTATIIQVRELFPGAVDVHIKTVKGGVNKDKSIAAITLPSTMEARAAVKNQNLSLGGNQLTVKFDNQKIKKKSSTKPQEIKKNQKASAKDKVSSKKQPEVFPNKTQKLNVTEKKQNGKMPQPKPVPSDAGIGKSVNKKRKLPPTEENANIGNKLPKNKGINKKRKLNKL